MPWWCPCYSLYCSSSDVGGPWRKGLCKFLKHFKDERLMRRQLEQIGSKSSLMRGRWFDHWSTNYIQEKAKNKKVVWVSVQTWQKLNPTKASHIDRRGLLLLFTGRCCCCIGDRKVPSQDWAEVLLTLLKGRCVHLTPFYHAYSLRCYSNFTAPSQYLWFYFVSSLKSLPNLWVDGRHNNTHKKVTLAAHRSKYKLSPVYASDFF